MAESQNHLRLPLSPPSPLPPSMQSANSSVCGSLRGSFRDLRESLRELRLPRVFSMTQKKSVSAFNIAADMARSITSSPTDSNNIGRKRQCASTGNIPRKDRRKAVVNWHNYTPNRLNKQFHLGKSVFFLKSVTKIDLCLLQILF